MKFVLAAAVFAVAAPFAHADTAWKWTDARGTIHYANVLDEAPPTAVRVTTEISHAPTATPLVAEEHVDADHRGIPLGEAPSEARPVGKKLHKIYDEERLRFGCYSAGVLYYGGWSHPDDISPSIGCSRYLFGPEAWLNAARAELAVRENGISPKELYHAYREGQAAD